MMKCLLRKSVFLASVFVVVFLLHNGNVFTQGLDKEISLEENIPTKEGLTVKYIAADCGARLGDCGARLGDCGVCLGDCGACLGDCEACLGDCGVCLGECLLGEERFVPKQV